MGQREDLYVVTAVFVFNGETRNLGVFDTWDGGEIDSEETKYPRGGLQGEVSLGGRRKVGNVTIARLYDAFMQEQEPWLDAACGKAVSVLTKQPLDENGSAFGRSRTYTGKLLTMTPPKHDSTSSNPALITLVISTNSTVG